MAKESINWNLLLIAGGAVAVAYFWNKIANNRDEVLDAKLPIVESRTERVEIRQENQTERWGDFLDTVRDIFNKDNKQNDVSGSNDKKVKKGTVDTGIYDSKKGELQYKGLGYSVAPQNVTKLVNKTNLATAQQAYQRITVNPYAGLTNKSLRG